MAGKPALHLEMETGQARTHTQRRRVGHPGEIRREGEVNQDVPPLRGWEFF